MGANPIDGFVVDRAEIRYIGEDLQRPECILAERDGTLWAADARGGVVRITADGRQEIITQRLGGDFAEAATDAEPSRPALCPTGLHSRTTATC